jgi:hypothetical protein
MSNNHQIADLLWSLGLKAGLIGAGAVLALLLLSPFSAVTLSSAAG